MKSAPSLRWLVLGVFIGSSMLNYLDRQILAALAPLLRTEFRLSNTDYGLILSAFSVVYAVAAPAMGICIDRVGLRLGISLLVALWSAAGAATGLVNSLAGLLCCRALLGAAQAGGVPATGKAIHLYLRPGERALGNAFSQTGLSVGAMMAPPLATWLALGHGWRAAFLATGVAGFLWIPVWRAVARRVPPEQPAETELSPSATGVLRDRRLWGFVTANILSMAVYTLWTNWTTVYLVEAHGLTLAQAARYAWVPPLAANFGGLLGGWLSWRWIRAGSEAVAARRRVCFWSACGALLAALTPFLPTPLLATAAISLSFFWVTSFSVNLYSMPLDVFGAGRAAFSVALLTGSYGGMQTVVSPWIGASVDRFGFQPVCLIVAAAPLAAAGILRLTKGSA
jgi:MFS transporter, ACS family, hexuronate transporter